MARLLLLLQLTVVFLAATCLASIHEAPKASLRTTERRWNWHWRPRYYRRPSVVVCSICAGVSNGVSVAAVNTRRGLFLIGGANDFEFNNECKKNLPRNVKRAARNFLRKNRRQCLPSTDCKVLPSGACDCSGCTMPRRDEVCEIKVTGGLGAFSELFVSSCQFKSTS